MGRLSNSKSLRLGNLVSWSSSNKKIDIYEKNLVYYLRFLCQDLILIGDKKVQIFSYLVDSVSIRKDSHGIKIEIALYDSYFFQNKKSGPIKNLMELRGTFLDRLILNFFSRQGGSNPLFIEYSLLSVDGLTSNILVEYIRLQLIRRVSLSTILNLVRQTLLKSHNILGFRITISGRFTRKQRAGVKTLSEGQISFSTLQHNLDYSEGTATLKYGQCGLKVWLSKV